MCALTKFYSNCLKQFILILCICVKSWSLCPLEYYETCHTLGARVILCVEASSAEAIYCMSPQHSRAPSSTIEAIDQRETTAHSFQMSFGAAEDAIRISTAGSAQTHYERALVWTNALIDLQ